MAEGPALASVSVATLAGATGATEQDAVWVGVADVGGSGDVFVFDVSAKRNLYGADGPYNVFAGVDASRALAKSSTKPEDIQAGRTDDLDEKELKTLKQWFEKFDGQYPKAGKLAR